MTVEDRRVPDLEQMRAEWRAHARYRIKRCSHQDGRFVKTTVGHGGWTYDDGRRECERLDRLAWAEEGSTLTSFGRTLHTLELENPLPPGRTAA